jgi:hypothetical protein
MFTRITIHSNSTITKRFFFWALLYLPISISCVYLLPYTTWGSLVPSRMRSLLYNGTDTQSMAVLLLFIELLSWAIVFRWLLKTAPNTSRLLWYLLGLILLAYLLPCFELNSPMERQEHVVMALSLSAGLLCALLCQNTLQGVVLLIISITLQSLYALIYWRHGQYGVLSGTIFRAGGTFNSPNLLACMLSSTIFLIGGLIYETQSRSKPLWMCLYGSLFVCALTLFLTWSRSAFMAVGMSILVILRKVTRKSKLLPTDVVPSPHRSYYRKFFYSRYSALLLTALTLSFVLLCFTFRGLGARNARSLHGSNRGHIHFLTTGWNIFLHHWLYGDNWETAVTYYTVPHSLTPGGLRIQMVYASDNPACLPLYILDTFGIVGAFWMLLVIGTIWRCLTPETRPLHTAQKAAWLCYAVTSFFNIVFDSDYPTGIYFVGFLLGLTLLSASDHPSNAIKEMEK